MNGLERCVTYINVEYLNHLTHGMVLTPCIVVHVGTKSLCFLDTMMLRIRLH